jgi:nicotinate-nucleotide pyrophosphorylase (carboxylating)
MWNKLIDDLIDLAIREDIGDGDHTSLACIPKNAVGSARLLVKEQGIIAGIEVARRIFNILDPDSVFDQKMDDGSKVNAGDIAFIIKGRVQSILQAERLVLNIMQRMSGIATQTREYADALTGFKTKVLDTRKTNPGMRILDKYAVKIGGGENHRIGLYDMMLIKDNHIDFAGGIVQAIVRTQEYLGRTGKKLKIEVEARNLQDVKIILDTGGIDRILLDNFSLENTREAVKIINNRCETESSGNVTLKNIRLYAECGVDYISAGALTHHIKSIDLSLKAIDF